jgi:N-methylhydantoinase A
VATARLRVGIDVGGTFTDLVAVDAASGERSIVKSATTPKAPEEGVLAALDELFSRFPETPRIEYLAHSTTIATNALLGQIHLELPRVAFVTTAGFRDVIEIGRQNRSEVYNLFVTRPRPLVAREDRIVVHERMDANGDVLLEPDDAEIARVVEAVRSRNPDAVAVGFLHSYASDAHELKIAGALQRALPGVPVTWSAQVDPEYREYERFSTAVVNAALLPIVRGYLDRLQHALRTRGTDAPLYVMQSSGGMARADRIAQHPAAIIESGPASGVIAAAELAKQAHSPRVLSFDMGGTTAKAGTIVDGVVQVATEFEAAGSTHSGRSIKGSGYPVRFPFVDLAEVSAGGGTIAHLDAAGALQVGPVSAGADPGPACYGRSDRATVTDANVVLGRLNQQALVGGTFPIDASRSRAAIAPVAQRLGLSIEETAAGIVRIVDAQMAKVLRIVTVERGLDPRDFAMVAFGGNGPLHACSLAEELDVARVLVPADPGVFSAHGLLVADLQATFVRPVLRESSGIGADELQRLFSELEAQGTQALQEQGAAPDALWFLREFDARYAGQSFELAVEYSRDGAVDVSERFHEQHRRRYGYAAADEPVELVNARLTASARLARSMQPPHRNGSTQAGRASRDVWLDGSFCAVPVYDRAAMPANIIGPALIEQYDTCTFVAPGWTARSDATLLLLERTA